MNQAEKIAFLDAIGRETANVILAELRKIEGATTGDMLISMESLVLNLFLGIELTAGKEGKILKQLRENVMWRMAQQRVLEGKAKGNA
jgi:hypothetical protein